MCSLSVVGVPYKVTFSMMSVWNTNFEAVVDSSFLSFPKLNVEIFVCCVWGLRFRDSEASGLEWSHSHGYCPDRADRGGTSSDKKGSYAAKTSEVQVPAMRMMRRET